MWPEEQVYRTFTHRHFRDIGPANATTVRLRMHRGISVSQFQNPHHARQLLALGLRPDTAFGCALYYLFRPRPEVLQLINHTALAPLHSALTDPYQAVVGIQVRLGDAFILQQHGQTLSEQVQSKVDAFLSCAEVLSHDIALYRGINNTREAVTWYVMTDTPAVVAYARQRFGSAFGVYGFDGGAVEFFRNVTRHGFRLTVAEHWLFSLCHYHVITAKSGMGRTAAFASLQYGSVYSIDDVAGASKEPKESQPASPVSEVAPAASLGGPVRGCLLHQHDRPLEIFNVWSGV